MEEYSYYQAAGSSLTSYREAQENQAEYHRLVAQLKRRFDACEIFFGRAPDKKSTAVKFFIFEPDQALPENWKEVRRQLDSNGAAQFIFAEPAPGSADARYIVGMMSFIHETFMLSKLENAWGCPDDLRRAVPPGAYSDAFVRESMTKTPGMKEGIMKQKTLLYVPTSQSATSLMDPIEHLEFEGKVYLRIPNDATGKPIVVPPDAIPLSLDQMLEIDRQEMNRRNVPRYDRPLGGKRHHP